MKKEQVFAGILGLVVADALGVPYEFLTRFEMEDNPAVGMIGYGTYNMPPGYWSDDSSLTLATLDSLSFGLDYKDIMDKFLDWYKNANYTPNNEIFGVGKTTKETMEKYSEGANALDCGGTDESSIGNGALRRMLPICFYLNKNNVPAEEMISIVDGVSSLTHNTKISKIACNIYNFIIQEIIDNSDEYSLNDLIERGILKSLTYYDSSDLEEFQRIFDKSIFELEEDQIGSSGYVVSTLETVLYCCYTTKSYQEAVLKAVNLGEDTDTIGAITGSITALYYGLNSIPTEWIETIVNSELISQICENFTRDL